MSNRLNTGNRADCFENRSAERLKEERSVKIPTMKTCVITGSTGFVGANLARHLIASGHKVHLLVRPNHSGWRINNISDDCAKYEVDFCDYDRLSSVIRDVRPEWIFHLAANGAYSWQTDVEEILRTNFLGTCNLIRCCAELGFEAFVNTGSSSEYGFKNHAPTEDDYVDPNSYYAVTKAASTLFCRYTANAQKLRIPTLRLYSVYGPFEEPNRLMPTLVVNGLQGMLPNLVNPKIARDYVSIDDVCAAYTLAAEVETADFGAVYNVGTGVQTSLEEIVDVAVKALGIEQVPDWGSMPDRSWDTSVWVADNTKIKRDLGWNPADKIEVGFQKMIRWLKSDQEMLRFYRQKIIAGS